MSNLSNRRATRLPKLDLAELDLPAENGLRMHGWDFSQAEIARALRDGAILNPALELAPNFCPWNCDFCFTEKGLGGTKRKLRDELTLAEKLELIESLAQRGTRSINIVGAGEPTIDPDFFTLIDAIAAAGIVPIVYTEGSLKLSDLAFTQRLYDSGATVVLKVNSLVNPEYQNAVLLSGNPSPSTPKFDYFERRKQALANLIAVGFNSAVPTRLAFDTIACRENFAELEALHRYARDNNIFLLLVNYLPSGRSTAGHTNAISRAEQFGLFARLAEIDRSEYGIEQRGIHPYNGSQPCLIRGTGLFLKINGDVLACPGETVPVGNIRREPLDQIWQTLAEVRRSFDGSCPPRERFWKALNS